MPDTTQTLNEATSPLAGSSPAESLMTPGASFARTGSYGFSPDAEVVTPKPEAAPAAQSEGEQGKTEAEPVKDANAEVKPDAKADGEKDPPFHEHPRWKQLQQELTEARAKADKAERFAPVLEDLEKSGYKDGEAVRAYIEQQQVTQTQQQSQFQEQQYRDQLAQQLMSQVNEGVLDFQTADLQFRNAVLQRDQLQLQEKMQSEQKATLAKLEAFEKDQTWASAAKDAPLADKEEVMAYHKAGLGSIPDLAKRSHTKASRLIEQGKTEAMAALAKNAAAPSPMTGSNAPGPVPTSQKLGNGFMRFFPGHNPV